MTELKPCWCGGHPVTVHEAMMFDGYGFSVRCVRCGCQTKFKPTEEQAAEEWNRAFASNEALHTKEQGTCRIELPGTDYQCNGCGEIVGSTDPTSELYIDGNAIELWNYCPYCGRKVGA